LLRLFRICRNIYNPMDPTGASQTPGRWHNLGQGVLYFCSSLAMCILELKANSIPFSVLRKEYQYIDLEIDTDNITVEEVPKSFYSKDWVLDRQKTQEYGDQWFKAGSSLILKVSSAVLPTDSNFILNTAHPNFTKLKFQKPLSIPLDPRVK